MIADKYGELIVLGYNGKQSVLHAATKHNSRFEMQKRQDPNGIVKSRHYTVEGPVDPAISSAHHSVTFTLGRNKSIIVEYKADRTTDMFQIGRSSESQIDFTVVDTWLGAIDELQKFPGNNGGFDKPPQSTISRYACRILVSRDEPNDALVYAAGFDSSKNIFLGEKASKWHKKGGEMDGLTTNGVLLLHPKQNLKNEDNADDVGGMYVWREVSVDGDIFTLRETRSSPTRGNRVTVETNVLQDGSLIDLCGATLLFRSAEGLSLSPTKLELEEALDNLNASRPICPVNLNTLVIPKQRGNYNRGPECQPYVYLTCGHIQGYHGWGHMDVKHRCPICQTESNEMIQVSMGMEPAFHLDSSALNYAFNPCGHIASEKTVKYWSRIPLPHGANNFHPVCPFCTTLLNAEIPYVKLIFQQQDSISM